MCIKVHNGPNISNTSFELFDLENVQPTRVINLQLIN
jgi:hypothetical protein